MFGGIGKALSTVGKGIGKAAGAMAGGSRIGMGKIGGSPPLMPDCGWGGPKKTGMGKKLLTSRPLGSKR